MTQIFVGDTGTIIKLDCGVDISTATVHNIVVRKPNGTKVTWTGTVSGASTIIYITQAGDLDIAGTWHFQAFVTMPGWSGLGEVVTLDISNPV